MVVFLVMAVPAFLGIRVALDRPCDDGHQDAFLRRSSTTKVGAGGSIKYTDGNDFDWTIDEIMTSTYVATSKMYSPEGKAFGDSLSTVKANIEKWAGMHKPGKLFTDWGGVRVDGNGAFWTRIDRWAASLAKYPPEIPSGPRFAASSTGYSPPASVTADTELLLVDRINAYAASHKPAFSMPVPSSPAPEPIPGPGKPATPPTPSPVPSPAPSPTPAPGPGAPVAKAEGGTLLYAGMGIGVAALIGWGLLS